MPKMDTFSCICVTILFVLLDVLLVIAYFRQHKIVKELRRSRLEREKKQAQMNEI